MLYVSEFPARVVRHGNAEYLYFGGTDYLGLSTHPDFIKLLCKNIQKWGVNYGSSRLSNVRLSVYEEAEAAFAEWLGCEAALTVSSGTLAARLALESLEANTPFYHLTDTHPTAIHPKSKIWDNSKDPKEKVVLSADTFPTMAVKATPFNKVLAHSTQNLYLVADDSHGIGISGDTGKGLCPALKNLPITEGVLVASLAKAMCLPGGLIAGSKKRIGKIKTLTGFITASGMPPAYLQSFLEASSLYQQQYERLQNNLKIFSNLIKNDIGDFIFSPDYPVLYSTHLHLGNFLKENHLLITNFDYPKPGNTLNRIVLSAYHHTADLQRLAVALKKFVKT